MIWVGPFGSGHKTQRARERRTRTAFLVAAAASTATLPPISCFPRRLSIHESVPLERYNPVYKFASNQVAACLEAA